MASDVDVVVVGLGPGGEYLAGELAEAGLDVVAVDRRLVGGECLYFGCIPTKMMIRGADLLAESRRANEMAGHTTVDPDWSLVAKRIAEQATDHWNDQTAVNRLVGKGARVVHGRGKLTGLRTVVVGNEEFRTRRGVVLNTGTEPGVPPIDGLIGSPYWTNRDAVQLTELPASLIVIGGGAFGVELSQAFARFGVAVTVLEVADRLVALEEPESSALVANVFEREGIEVLTGIRIVSVRHHADGFTVTVADEAGERALTAEQLLVAAGRRPNLPDLGLDSVGLDPLARVVETDDHLRAAEGLWAIGDITGKGAFTHMSMYQAGIVIRDVLGKGGPWADYRAVPHVTFTDPEIGSVGMTEAQAREAGLDVRVGFTELSASTRGWIHQAGNDGFIKLVEDAGRGVLVGATSAGPSGGEILAALTVAIHGEVPTDTLRSMIYAYPTFHRGIEATLATLG